MTGKMRTISALPGLAQGFEEALHALVKLKHPRREHTAGDSILQELVFDYMLAGRQGLESIRDAAWLRAKV